MDEVNWCIAGMVVGSIGSWLHPFRGHKFGWGDFFAGMFLYCLVRLVFLSWLGELR